MLITVVAACKKDKVSNSCADGPTVRHIINKRAIIKVGALIHPVYLVEEGSVDTKLVPCNFPPEFYQADLEVVINGEVKGTPQPAGTPCCFENFVITKISR